MRIRVQKRRGVGRRTYESPPRPERYRFVGTWSIAIHVEDIHHLRTLESPVTPPSTSAATAKYTKGAR